MVSSRPIPENQLSSYVVKNANLRWGTALEITPSQVKIPATQSFIDSWKDAHIYHEKLPVTSGFNDMEPPKRAPEPIATLPLVAENTTRNKEPPLAGSNLQSLTETPKTNRHDNTPVPNYLLFALIFCCGGFWAMIYRDAIHYVWKRSEETVGFQLGAAKFFYSSDAGGIAMSRLFPWLTK